jgi:hypothetical protein
LRTSRVSLSGQPSFPCLSRGRMISSANLYKFRRRSRCLGIRMQRYDAAQFMCGNAQK